MYETKVEYPAVFILARAVKDERRIIAMLDNKVLTNDAEMGARLMTYRLLEEAGAIPYELTLANVDQAEAVKAERIAWLAYENGWGPNPEKNEAEDAPTASPAPKSPQAETGPDQDTTERPEPQATATVEFLWDRMQPPDDTETWLIPQRETWVRYNGSRDRRPAKMKLDDILDLRGWSHGPMKMVDGNYRPGRHLYAMEMAKM